MKIHSLSYRKKGLYSNRSLIENNPLQSNEIKDQLKNNNFDIVKINLKKNTQDKDKSNSENKKYESKKTDNLENNENQQINQVVPQKILKFNKKSLTLKKKMLNEKNINIYQNTLLDKLQLIITNNKHSRNKIIKKVNNAEVQINLPPETNQNHNSLFDNYREYQKEFFSSSYNLNIYNHKKKDEFTQIKSPSITPIYHQVNKNKKNIFNTNSHNSFNSRPISNILQRKYHGDLPIFLNSPVTFIKNFKSNSEKERDEKNSHALLRLRDFLDIYWDKRIELVTEFFSTYQINGDEYYTLKNLENFAHYVYDNINDNTNVTKGIIETRIPMKEIIDKGIQYKNYSLKKLKISKSLPEINKKKINIKKRNLTGYNWYKPQQSKNRNKSSNYLSDVNFRKSRTFGKIDVTNMNDCFYNENYINNDYQISDNETNQKINLNEKIEKYKKFLNKNYGVKVTNKFMRKYNQNEKNNYFNKRKVGTIDIPDKDNLINNINKQSNFYKLKSTCFSKRKSQSIHTFSENDFKELYNELKEAKQSYIYDKKDNNNKKENIWLRMYEDVKKHKFEKRPELILKKKKKLLEYIIFQSIQERKQFEKDLLK